MTYCTHCGAPLDGAVNFCKTCGAKLAKGKSLALSAKTPGATLAERQNTPVANATPAANETATSDTSQTPPASTPSQNPTLDGRKKLAIFIGAGVAVAALILALLFTAFPNPERPLTVAQLLDLGEKYLLELDYEQALVQFMAVIEIEPINGRGYIGAAEAYIGLGDNDSAVEILWEGYEITSNAEIWRMFGEVAAEQEPAVETAPDSTTTENETEASHVRSAQVGDIIEFGGYDWRVLDVQDEKALVISEYVINNRQYHNEMGDITWADSEIRSYLNGEFYNSF